MARTILVVEDDEATRVGLLVLLAEAGYRTVGAATLKQATELLANQKPDLLITKRGQLFGIQQKRVLAF